MSNVKISELESAAALLSTWLSEWADENNKNFKVTPAQVLAFIESNATAFAAAIHDHDDRYYTKSEIDALLAGLVDFGDPT